MSDLVPLTPTLTQTFTSRPTPTTLLTRSPTTVPTTSDFGISISNLPLAGAMELSLDDSLPEMLVRDLELSKSVFEEKNMTSGAPVPNINLGCKTSMTFAPRLSTPYRTMSSSRVQFLDDIEEQSSTASVLDEPKTEALHHDEVASDVDSLTGTEHSFDAGPHIFHMREQSIITNATSLASSGFRPSKSLPLPTEPRRDCSWIEIDSDDDDDDDQVDEVGGAEELYHQHHGYSRSCQLPTPPVLDAPEVESCEPHNINTQSHRKSYSMNAAVSLSSQPRYIRSPVECRPPSRSHHKAKQETSQHYQGSTGSRHSLESSSPPRRKLVRRRTAMSESPGRAYALLESQGRSLPAEDDDEPIAPVELRGHGGHLRNTLSARPSPPPSRHSDARTQADMLDYDSGNSQPFMLPLHSDELARIVPLPPDVIETLKISTLCFPETMLLSSSLTIETIRSYSRKARQPSAELSPITSGASSTIPTGSAAGITSQKSRWRRVVKRGGSASQKRRGSHGSSGSSLRSSSSTTLDVPKPWAAFKNVFNFCSDYICDALYAHIVAFNYVSALLARNPQPLSSSSRHPCSLGRNDKDDIPKKAASLLGFGSSANMAPRGALGSLAKRSRPELTTAAQSNSDASLRSIQSELLRCIRQLIATARLMAEDGSGEERMIEMEAQDHDRILLRSLCEIVRLSEGTIYG